MDIIFKILGAVGLVMIITGVLIKKKQRKFRDVLYIVGGGCLATYSIYIRDAIFIALQMVFILVAIYDLVKLQVRK